MGITRSVRQILACIVRTVRAPRLIALCITAIIATALMPSTPAWTVFNPLVLNRQVVSNDISDFTKWTVLLPRYEAQRLEALTACIGQDCMNQRWENLLTHLRGKPLAKQVDAVNRFFNAVAYVSDRDNYGIADYWQTPYEMMVHGGDCEDYAIAKYISLKRLGVPESRMRIIVARDANLDGTVHAMLEVMVGSTPVILDNQSPTTMPVANIFHYDPIFAINEAAWWSYK